MDAPATGHEPPAIDLDSIVKTYDGAAAVDHVSLAIPAGQFVALVGGSGSGKTTLLKTINGLILPDSGRVAVEGRMLATAGLTALRRRIGYVFQEIGLFPHMSVGENIAIVPRLEGWDASRVAARVAELLDLVALPDDVTQRLPSELSGGQRQRVGVARALAAGPSIMLMDEPFGALDPIVRDALARDYLALHRRLSLTTVMVTHDIMEALRLADRVVVLQSGRVLADDAPRALLAGHADETVRALIDTPKRQADEVRALAEAGA
jgi:osmoprotectant transport system ATP-binding protein